MDGSVAPMVSHVWVSPYSRQLMSLPWTILFSFHAAMWRDMVGYGGIWRDMRDTGRYLDSTTARAVATCEPG